MTNSNPPTPLSRRISKKAAIAGAITSIVVTIPISVVKQMGFFDTWCSPFLSDRWGTPFSLTYCGVFFYTVDANLITSLVFLAYVAMGGTLSGLLVARAAQGTRWAEGDIFRGFLGGFLFNLLFVFFYIFTG